MMVAAAQNCGVDEICTAKIMPTSPSASVSAAPNVTSRARAV